MIGAGDAEVNNNLHTDPFWWKMAIKKKVQRLTKINKDAVHIQHPEYKGSLGLIGKFQCSFLTKKVLDKCKTASMSYLWFSLDLISPKSLFKYRQLQLKSDLVPSFSFWLQALL